MTGPPPADLVAAKAHLAVRRLEDVSRTAVGMDPAARSLMGQTLEELAATFEELRAAGEELTRANTELRRVHSELREGRRAFQELFDFAPDGYLISDRFGAIRMANVTATARLGAGRWETLIGKPLTVLVALAHRSSFFAVLDRLRRSGDRQEWIGRMEPGGAPSFPARLVVVGRPDGDGIPHELLWLVHDLSDRERFELALRASEEAFRALAENGPDPIIRLDRDLRVEYANAATERLTGRRSGELVGARAAELFLSGEGADALADASARALAGAEEMVEVSFDAPAGRRWLELRIVPERGEGHVKRLLVVGRDVTARREAAQDLRESGDLKNTMLATVSHELRTPLTAIAAAADALAGAGAAKSGEMIELISGETTRLERMVGNLLDLSRLQGRAVTPRLEVYPVETLVGSALAAMGGSLDDVEVAIDLSDDAAFVMVDPMMVERILVNLLDNAMTHGAPPLRLLCRAEGGRVELSVADSGPGVPDGDEGRIFLPFVHGGSPGSAGIGLALALALAETQGALLALRRELGAGACFVLTLTPAEFEPDAEDAGMPREEEGG